MGLRVVINQSNYIPWKGYFDLIHDADLFIFLDDVQYTKNDWRNRNRIGGPNGLHWLTIPVGPGIDRRISEVPLPDGPWRQKHLRALRQSYAHAPHFERHVPFLEEIYGARKWPTLSAFNQGIIRTIATDFLGMGTRFCSSTELGVPGSGQDRVLGLLRAVGATEYISGPAGRAYLDEARFQREGLTLRWKDYAGYPPYLSLYPPCVHEVSIVDLLFCLGPAAPEYIWGWRDRPHPPPP